ncbi:hypothetical protein [Asticcacaulis machinosus]|uniref:Uncharacterized protein n=1 Tax=Asticcacaulis machinosus TaxID=2984211 RepID=A0ABT5HG73_9CAUL|nr:hypothetical protein [Asticcacaulis machinosus]MDC7675183.1 hypothetical protein [Asticcacaulis machinosus]
MEPTTLTSLAGSLMSLFGVLVSLFSVHLGNWLAKLQGLRTKWDMNNGSDEKEISARRECRYTMAEIYTWQPFIMTVIILGFAIGVIYFFHDVSCHLKVVFPSIFVPLYYSFFGIMIVLELFLLYSGWQLGRALTADIKAQFKPQG